MPLGGSHTGLSATFLEHTARVEVLFYKSTEENSVKPRSFVSMLSGKAGLPQRVTHLK